MLVGIPARLMASDHAGDMKADCDEQPEDDSCLQLDQREGEPLMAREPAEG